MQEGILILDTKWQWVLAGFRPKNKYALGKSTYIIFVISDYTLFV